MHDVYRYTLALLRNPADAEDITQTTFLNAYRAYKRGEEPLKPQNWLIKIAHNACRTRYVRASRRPQEVPLEDSLRELAVPADEIPNVKEVLDALARLPFNQRAALVMRELEGRSYTEIAAALDVTVPAVETLIFRARRALRVQRSALRSLGALPVPASLSSFSGGGVAVGGGALIGSGFVLKAILAVGIGVAAGTAGSVVEAKVLAPGGVTAPDNQGLTVEASTVSAGGARNAARVVSIAANALIESAGGDRLPSKGAGGAGLPRGEHPGATGSGGHASPGAAPTAAAPGAASAGSAPSPVTDPVGTVTETVGNTVPTPSVPSVPVETPTVEVPAVPPVPPLPPAPPVPVPPPPSLPVPPPPLPPPPTLP